MTKKKRKTAKASTKLPQNHDISYQNKDIASKIFGEGLKEKSFAVYGISVPKIVEVLPTNLPAIEANELRMDNLFRLEDGSYALVDYESEYAPEDKLKYLGYIVRTAKKLYASGIHYPHIRMIVIYTSNVKQAESKLNLGCLQFQTEVGYLAHIPTKQTWEKLYQKISDGNKLTDEELMLLIILPLTADQKTEQKELIRDVIQLTCNIEDDSQQIFALSGILTFSDKIIDKDYAENIRRWIQMTQVGRLFQQEKEDAVKEAISTTVQKMQQQIDAAQDEVKAAQDEAQTAKQKACILQLLLKGYSIEEAAERFHMNPSDAAKLIQSD